MKDQTGDQEVTSSLHIVTTMVGTRPTSGLNHVHLKVAMIVDEKLDLSSSPERGVDDFEQGEQAGHFGLVVWGQIAPGGASM